jgi:hypothetical protein
MMLRPTDMAAADDRVMIRTAEQPRCVIQHRKSRSVHAGAARPETSSAARDGNSQQERD